MRALLVALLSTFVIAGCQYPYAGTGEQKRKEIAAEEEEGEDAEPEGEADEQTKPPKQEETPAATPSPEPEKPAEKPVEPAPPAIPAGSFAKGTKLVTTANLNLREAGNTAAAILVEIPTGTTVEVAAISGADGWVNLSFDGKTGFSSKQYLAEAPK